ncbi:uncharacterized protein L969DRAFT_95948 [Mixia osmundae IAM 14324]|uniref:Uncharacterized protein n=1 Tax=Mixia osmundae (strain CBS 9802 / IAM 14324 / JCM 22182 / KY 12970) TaxID=764103 RepID=G7DWY2_MIXOS|nr:uncharacterized protein L969DRAFT_95948 [Mixia osmundae IAM 14324]KEI38111.1 hypothetical protein L969DRAFT_95948 [Mixia osmundae IAM 14324]GAA95079.1 hypothetical protein E5Q_01734 [Mixia osmundae IAM 14324]
MGTPILCNTPHVRKPGELDPAATREVHWAIPHQAAHQRRDLATDGQRYHPYGRAWRLTPHSHPFELLHATRHATTQSLRHPLPVNPTRRVMSTQLVDAEPAITLLTQL